MTSFLIYLAKLISCSGLFCLYYWVFLRNGTHHTFNRVFLLLSVVASMLFPLLKFSPFDTATQSNDTNIPLLQVVENTGYLLDEIVVNAGGNSSFVDWFLLSYAIVSAFFLLLFLKGILKLYFLLRGNIREEVEGVRVLYTSVGGAPFTFFNTIFWNPVISLATAVGQKIFRHERAHVRGWHSYDKVFLQSSCILFWINPFFWIMKRELSEQHEFIADKEAVENGDSAMLASMILSAHYPGQFSTLAHSFFNSTIKRRLHMLTTLNLKGKRSIATWIALPFLLAVGAAFTIRTTEKGRQAEMLADKLTVVIDAGHGYINGSPSGASVEGMAEDDVVLAISREVQALNSDPNLRLILSRPSKEQVGLKERVGICQKENADLFISIHLDATSSTSASDKGFQVLLPRTPANDKSSRLLGSALAASLKEIYTVVPSLQAVDKVWVLNQNPTPAVMLQLGNLYEAQDRAFVSDEQSQRQIAEKILAAIYQYGAAREKGLRNDASQSESGNDTIPSVDQNDWRKFLEANLMEVITAAAAKGAPVGTHRAYVRFKVGIDGSLADFSLTKDPGYGIGEKILALMPKSPKWKPAERNGKKIAAYHVQPISFVIAE